jgi:hypothetical protein
MAHLTWSRGGEADVTALDGDRISVLSTIPSAPGSRPEGALAAGGGVAIKVARCRKQDDRFLIEGRLINVTRDTRAAIQALLAPPPA